MSLANWLQLTFKQATVFTVGVMVLLSSTSSTANERPSLYLAEVSAEQTQQQWQREALQHVLVRVTGQPDIMQQAALRQELNNAASYVKQFEAVRTEQGNYVRVLLDAQRIQRVLQQLQIPIWGGQRPELLFWIVEQQQGERQFMRQADHVGLMSLQSALAAQGLPYTLPLYDMDDLLNVSETDVWGGFWPQITAASARYQVQQIVLLLLENTGSPDNPSWRLTALRKIGEATDDTLMQRDEMQADTLPNLMQQYATLLSEQLTRQYAILLNADAQQHVSIQINGATSLADVINIERRLSTLLGVSRVQIVEQGEAETVFAVTLQMQPEQLVQSLEFDPHFKQHSNRTSWSVDDVASGYLIAPAAEVSPVFAVFDYIRP